MKYKYRSVEDEEHDLWLGVCDNGQCECSRDCDHTLDHMRDCRIKKGR